MRRRPDLAVPILLALVATAGVALGSGGVYHPGLQVSGANTAGALPAGDGASGAAWNTTLLLSGGLARLGGATAAFPALKRAATTLEVRLADDSAYAPVTAGALLATTSVVDHTEGVGAPYAVTAAESGRAFPNAGAAAKVYLTLPATAVGLRYTGVVQDADGLRFTAPAGSTIRLKTTVSAAGGFVESTEVGSTITLLAISATEWYAVEALGTWTTG